MSASFVAPEQVFLARAPDPDPVQGRAAKLKPSKKNCITVLQQGLQCSIQ